MPSPGSKRYKGPVHEAVRSGLGALGINVGSSASSPAPTRRTYTTPAPGPVKMRTMSQLKMDQARSIHGDFILSGPSKAGTPKPKPRPKTRTVAKKRRG